MPLVNIHLMQGKPMEDVFISLVKVKKANWSFDNGINRDFKERSSTLININDAKPMTFSL